MHRFSTILAGLFAVSLSALPVGAEDLMPPHIAARLGLTQAWMRPINAPFGAQSIVDQQLYVHQVDPHEYIEVVMTVEAEERAATESGDEVSESTQESSSVEASEPAPSNKRVLARLEVARMGKSTSEANRAEAERLASNEIRRLKRRGIEATMETRQVPRVNLYSIATNGSLECRNAETGEVYWNRRVGDPRVPYKSIGVNDKYLSIVNGAQLIELDVNNGEQIASVRTRGAPLFGAINTGDFVVIPMVNGNIEGYPIKDTTMDPFLRSTAGRALSMPAKSPDSSLIAWATDAGAVYVAETSGKPAVLFRLRTDGIVSGRLTAASGDRFFFASENGQVYALRATRTGEVLWSQPFGEPFYNQPLLVGDQVVIATTYGNLVSFDAETGQPNWNQPIPNIDQPLTAFGGRMYVTTLSGSLAVVDLKQGKIVEIDPEVRPKHILVNAKTDRLYLMSESGKMQCLRPIENELPTFIRAPDLSVAETEQQPAESESKPTRSPFDVGDEPGMDAEEIDPFAPAPGGEDPFGGGDDPFGGGAMDDDPFAVP